MGWDVLEAGLMPKLAPELVPTRENNFIAACWYVVQIQFYWRPLDQLRKSPPC
jgi:hypothetical protein